MANKPMSFPKRMLMYIIADLTLINLLIFYWVAKVPLKFVLSVIIIEIVALTVAIAFWAPKYKLKW